MGIPCVPLEIRAIFKFPFLYTPDKSKAGGIIESPDPQCKGFTPKALSSVPLSNTAPSQNSALHLNMLEGPGGACSLGSIHKSCSFPHVSPQVILDPEILPFLSSPASLLPPSRKG